MNLEYKIGALWMRGSLSYLEQLCLVSFQDAGHHVVLYAYEEVTGIPEGIEVRDANEVLPEKGFLVHERTGSPALHSDLFRYRLLAKEERMIWADTDAYCMKHFETETGRFFGWESQKHINGGVLGLPQDSEALRELLEFTNDEFAIPTWYNDEYTRKLKEAADCGNPIHASEQPWGVWGPHAVTHFLHKTGEAKFALPQECLYPFTYRDRRKMLKRNFDINPYITSNTYSVHLYGRRMRARLVEKEGGKPHHKSLLGQLLKKHDIDPDLAPLPASKAQVAAVVPTLKASKLARAVVKPVPASEKVGRGQINLTDLADKYGSDKGSKKHRYTELYQLLFLPYRHRKIDFLEMGLLIGGPEHGVDADRKTDDLPSVRMWLEYFTKAHIHGLDVSDFSWFKQDNFSFYRCDMDARQNIATAVKLMPKLDIVIDDASHASHHQQNGFLEVFPKLKSGGLYIIEDLRWQPDMMEKTGITKTGELFYKYQTDGVFVHSNSSVADAFNALRHDISGCFVFQAAFNRRKRHQVAVIHKR